MGQEIQEKFDSFRRKEKIAKRISILFAIIPFIIGCIWICYAYYQVQKLDEKSQAIKNELALKKTELDSLTLVGRKLESELMHTYGRPKDSLRPGAADTSINVSIRANNAINKLSNNYTPAKDITIRYYIKSIDDEKIVLSLKSLGYHFETRESADVMKKQKTNFLWCGRKVPLNDCKIVALALIRAGIEIKGINLFYDSKTTPDYKSNIIDIGGYKYYDNNKWQPMTVKEIVNAKEFPYDQRLK